MYFVLFALVIVSVLGVVVVLVRELSRRDRVDEARSDAEERADARARAALRREGGTPENPIVVGSAAVVEARAMRDGCPHCDGTLHVESHEVVLEGAHRLRRVVLKCGSCGRPSERFFRVDTPRVN